MLMFIYLYWLGNIKGFNYTVQVYLQLCITICNVSICVIISWYNYSRMLVITKWK